ncbi:MAG: hypothetical protein CL758_07785 [Chloroflexi bacterium]|nr:hypothetical protein [Chloroflexota bacterium]|tara:strand:+ start:8979 stop:9968 length:990 start_codon:yes stop_codon:yes gene_type:complete
MKVAITGASGHLGNNLINYLLSKGVFVRILTHKNHLRVISDKIEIHSGDILDIKSLEDFLKGIDIVFHLASRISINGSQNGLVWDTNVLGAKNLILTSIKQKVKKFVYCGSIHAFNYNSKTIIINENTSLTTNLHRPVYDRSKSEAITLINELSDHGNNIEVVKIYPTGILGPNDYIMSRMGRILLNVFNCNQKFIIDGGFNWVDVRDVSWALFEASKIDSPNEDYIIGGHWLTLKELFNIALNINKDNYKIYSLPFKLVQISAFLKDILKIFTNNNSLFTLESVNAFKFPKNISYIKAKKELKYIPRKIEDTLEDTYNWFKEEGLLKN